MMETCLLQNSDLSVVLSSGQLLVQEGKVTIGCHPLESLKRVLMFGNPQMTTQAMKACLESGIEIHYYNKYGKYLGMVHPHENRNTERRLQQYALVSDNDRRLAWGQAILTAKLKGCALEYRRLRDNHWHEPCHDFLPQLRHYEEALQSCHTVNELMGVEGTAARYYYGLFGESLPQGWYWHGRHYHPCPDAVNALLSLTYAMATGIFESQCRQHSLDPSLSFLHCTGYESGGLATDLVEVVRASLCDHLVLKALHAKVVQKKDFVRDAGSFRLTDDAFRKYIAFYREYSEPQIVKIASSLLCTLLEALETPQAVPNFNVLKSGK